MSRHTPEPLSAEQYQELIGSQRRTALIGYLSDWSAPCREMEPVLEAISQKYDGTLGVFTLDPDNAPLVAAEQNIASIPTLVLYRQGEPVEKLVGVRAEADVEKMLQKYL